MILNIHKIPRFPYHDTTLHLVVTWYLALNLHWIESHCHALALWGFVRSGFLTRYCILIIRNFSHWQAFPENIWGLILSFSYFVDWWKGFPCWCPLLAAAVHYTGALRRITRLLLHYMIQYSTVSSASSQGLVTSRVWARPGLETGVCPVNITIWQHPGPAASICRTCVFPSIRQHLTTLIHTFNNWFLPVKLSSFSTIQPEL